MGGCITLSFTYLAQYHVSSLYGRVYRANLATLPWMRSFLPIWEGVSYFTDQGMCCDMFPPYMGGCIACLKTVATLQIVSSLYGRVYRWKSSNIYTIHSFLPIWEGVSSLIRITSPSMGFPPYMGGCIGIRSESAAAQHVSSLYGRVYRV